MGTLRIVVHWPYTSYQVPSIKFRQRLAQGLLPETIQTPKPQEQNAQFIRIASDSSSNGSGPATTAGTTARPALTGIGPGQRILGEGACKCLLARYLLATNETLDRNSYGTINVGCRHVVT